MDSYGTNLYINDQLSIINDQLLFRISGGVFQWKMKNGTAGFRFSEQGGRKMKFLKQRLKHNAQSRSGFTLVELIVVLVILAILAAFTIPAMLGFVEDAKGKTAISEAREVYVAAQSAATEYYSNNTSGTTIPEKIAEYLASDFGMSKDELWTKTAVFDDGKSHDLAFDNNVAKTNRIYVMLGKKGSEDEGKVLEIQYLDKTGKYIVIISAGGSAEVTKIK